MALPFKRLTALELAQRISEARQAVMVAKANLTPQDQYYLGRIQEGYEGVVPETLFRYRQAQRQLQRLQAQWERAQRRYHRRGDQIAAHEARLRGDNR